MRAVVWHGVGDIRMEEVPDPGIQDPTDAVIRITASAICGTDLHFVRGTMPGMQPGTILGHEAVGVVEEVGPGVRNLAVGDRVVVPSTISCGACSYCRAGYTSQCDEANPAGPGTAFYGGPADAGGIDGLQAEFARIPFAHADLVKLPEEVSDHQALLLSDIFPTAWFGATLAEVTPGDTVAVFGCGPVGQFAIASAKLLGAGRIIAVDTVASRLDMARVQGAEVVDFNAEDPVATIQELTGGIGVDRAIDCVGIDAESAHGGPAAEQVAELRKRFELELEEIAPEQNPDGDLWRPGDGPSQALFWATRALAKAGTLGIVGVYPPKATTFPIGEAMNKNLTIRMGNCPHRRIIPELLARVRSGEIDPAAVLTRHERLGSAIEAYEAFDQRQPGWVKVELVPSVA
jgi:threonine dehydrogenase-like Zn-dependent dehydrogenase